jgi:hypothetical protein
MGVEKIREGSNGLEEGKQLNFYLTLGPNFSCGIRTETLVRVDNNHMAISSPLSTGLVFPFRHSPDHHSLILRWEHKEARQLKNLSALIFVLFSFLCLF